ncbi:proteasome regulatory particle lid subunit [Starmerella bacillaris]|uniref:Proteasome regulatory particle lid subunit n=1 Tax=Starmerella bacillaris TaxID=1247836 RepID=A0AAV5RNH6_STABA|nr:proteasome regulatory particle lid subunit [Starmerella bacillaris]
MSSTRPVLREAESLGLPAGESKYLEVVNYNVSNESASAKEKIAQDQEVALLALGAFYSSNGNKEALEQLVATARQVTGEYAKSKSAKIIKALVDDMAAIDGSSDLLIKTIEDCIDWAVSSNRSFLRQSLQIRLLDVYYNTKKYQVAVELASNLLTELKKLDDKMMLVEVQLQEARVFHALRNLAKARASLTSARVSANAVYTPTLMQARLDMMSGVLQAEEGDYKTAFSYFYESFEGYSSLNDRTAVQVLKYLLLVKVMLNLNDDVEQLMHHKAIKQYHGRDIDAMVAMSHANSNRSLKDFESVLKSYNSELSDDPFVRSHFAVLYDKMFQENLMKVIEPYSCVEISHLSRLLGLDSSQVEGKLSQMILDKVFNGILDQGKGWLYIYPAPQADKTYEMGLETIKQMSAVVDTLYEKAAAIN